MADYLVEANSLNVKMGHDGLVVASSGLRMFTTSRSSDPLRIMTSTDGGQTWSLLASIDLLGADTFCAMFVDPSDHLHLVHRTNDGSGNQALRYKRYDSPGYSLTIDEAAVAHGSVDSWSPLGIIARTSDVIIFYEMTLAGRFEMRYARRTGVATWTTDVAVITGGFGDGLSYDLILGSDNFIYFGRQTYVWGSNTAASNSLRLHKIDPPGGQTQIFAFNADTTNRYNFFLVEVSSVVRIYASKTEGLAGSAEVLYRKVGDGSASSLFTAADANDALLGISKDSLGVHLYYGQAGSQPLRVQTHLNDLTLANDAEILATYHRAGADADALQILFPRTISNFNGRAGVYGQPLGTTRFFSTLVDAVSPTITITSPTSAATYATGASPITLGGTASDNVSVSSVTWSNSRGGSGTATGTTTWTAAVSLQPGSNVVTVTATDAAGNTANDSITITYVPGGASPGLSDFLIDWGLDESNLPRISEEELRRMILGRFKRHS